MPAAPVLTLVDPRAATRVDRRRRLLSLAVGIAIATGAAVPFALTLVH